MTRQNNAWYISQRGDLLAKEFLLELGAKHVASLEPVDVGIDYMAFFETKDNSTFIVAVEVKGTEKEVKNSYNISSSVVNRLKNINIPGIIIVADVKRNKIYFSLASEAAEYGKVTSGPNLSLPVTESNSNTIEMLKGKLRISHN